MKHIKKFLALACLLIMALPLAGCGYTAQEKAEIAKIEKLGAKNAVSFIKQKYGIDAKATDSFALKTDPSPIPDFTPPPSGEARVKMEYNGRQFMVYISGREESLNGADDYQYPEIMHMLSEYFRKDLGISVSEIHVSYGNDFRVREKINNIQELFTPSNHVSILAVLAKDAIEGEVKEPECENIKALLIKCNDSDIKDDLVENINYHDLAYGIQSYYPGIDYYFRLLDNGWEYHDIVKGDIDKGISYCYDSQGVENLIIEPSMDRYDASSWNGRGFLKAKRLSDFYSISFDPIENSGGESRVMIVFDVDEYPEDNVNVATHYYYKDQEKFRTASTYRKQKYIISTLYQEENQIFALFSENVKKTE